MFNFLKNCQSVFYSSYTILYSHQQCTRFPIFHILAITYYFHDCYCCCSYDHQPSRCEVAPHCGFWFAFLWWLMMLSIFSCAYWPFVYCLWKNIYLSLWLFAFCWVSELFTLDIKHLSNVWLANIYHFYKLFSLCW